MIVEKSIYRHRVSKLLLSASLPINRDDTTVTTTITQSNELIAELKALPYASEQIIQMMLDDLALIKKSIQRGLNVSTNPAMRQHAAYLDLGRGLRSMDRDAVAAAASAAAAAAAAAPDSWDDDPNVPELPRSPFSNRLQRHATGIMRSMSQAPGL